MIDGPADIINEELRIEQYPFTVQPLSENDGGGYLIEYPDIRGCLADREAITEGKDALRCALLTMMKFKDPIPEPGSSAVLAVPAVLRDRLTNIAEKRHMQPEQVSSEALARQEPGA